jgi:hypothetical protein
MPYRAPNTYARFVKASGTVTSPGSTRVMGLIGTGLNYYEIYNEPVQRNSDKPYDEMMNSNIFEIISVSQKPYINGKDTTGNKIYQPETSYNIKEGKFMAWNTLVDPTISDPIAIGIGAEAFATKITVSPDPANKYLAEDGEYIIEATYIGSNNVGTYRVINNLTQEVIGEYTVSDTANLNTIPGFALQVTSTYVADENDNSLISVGDYVRINTTAGLTEIPSTVNVLEDVSDVMYAYNPELATVIGNTLTISNINNLFSNEETNTATYRIVITNALAKTFEVYDLANTASPLYSGVVGAEVSYPEVISGVTFNFDTLPDTVVDNSAIEITTVKNINTNVPAEGALYYVSYKYKKAEVDYGPKVFFDYDDVVAEYGNYDVTVSGIILNSLALGAEIALTNGVLPIICVQAKNDSDIEMIAALNKLERLLPGVDNINTIVPLTDSATVGAAVMKHVDLMSSEENGKERMVYLGAARNQPISKVATVLDRSMGMVETAKAYNNERVVFVAPGEITKDIRDLRTGRAYERKLPACYAAVAVAALGLKNDPAEPLTHKTITGFKNLTTMYMESEKNFLAAAGCLVLDQNGSVIKVRHGITTSTAEIESAEITLVQIKDYVIDACRKSTATLYIGSKNRPSIVSDVQYTISSILNAFVSQSILLGFSGLSVKRSKEDPRQIDVKFEIEAVYPLNYISISFGFTANS